ncbi:hypothetical protein DL770_010591 [Monosporascus sp. CRB-9-2]|nr:hypothetical protein DL770_010591 [Monosporascus sp. CRB-9-2]
MAEAVGLTLGIVALAGTFKDCINLFDYISASRSLGLDYELLDTKLDVEKTLLLQWATRVGLVAEHPDPRLDQPDVCRAVSRVLAGIQLLLSDSQTLQGRYGMHAEGTSHPTDSISTVSDAGLEKRTLSVRRMARFIDDFKGLSVRTTKLQEAVPLRRKIRWAIHDKDKCEALIDQLSYFVSKLNEIVPDSTGALGPMMREDLGKLHVKKLQMIIQACIGREDLMAASAEEIMDKKCTDRILQLFWYRVMDDRRTSLADPHSGTFKWALEPSNQHAENQWDDISDWLKHGSGIYWISGKAGSGKSTLMKYLYGHRKTSRGLQSWADTTPLTKASFFFFALGTHEQKSQDGLVRALLYQIFKAEPKLIPTLFPELWLEARTSEAVELNLPSRGEAKKAFDTIREGLEVDRKFCFFIDGLDEFSGNYLDAVSFIESLAANPKIKVMVSSRPMPVCVQAFSGHPKLQLQDLTNGDIISYVESTIGSHPYMKELALAESYADTEESSLATQIIEELVSKASGVFLWVILACRSLLEGFAAYDNIEELRKRVDELPPELEDLFQHMLNKIDPRYQAEAAKILRICYHNQLDGLKRLPSVGLAIVDELGMDPRRVAPPRKLSDAEKRAKCQFLEGRLRSRCCGLLEISRPCVETVEYDCFCNAAGLPDTHNWLIDSHVQFMHRTVFNFLSQPGVWDIKCLGVQDPDFDADSVLSWVFVELLGVCGQRRNNDNWKYLRHALVHALRADSLAPRAMVPVLSRLDRILQNMLRDKPASLPFTSELSDLLNEFRNHIPFGLLFAIETGMVNYVRYCTESVTSLQNRAHTLLYHALQSPYLACLKSWKLRPSAEMVRFLLSTGSDPNAEFSRRRGGPKMTPWKYWRLEIHSFHETNMLLEAAKITKELLQAGGHVDAGGGFDEGELVETIQTYFVDCRNSSEAEAEEIAELREKGLELLLMIEDRRSGSTAGERLPYRDAQGSSRDARAGAGSKRSCDANYDGFVKRLRLGKR